MRKILLVEDDPLMSRLYERIFVQERYSVEVAKDGREGLDKVVSFHPDMILLDIMMKDMNGLEMLTELKASDVSRAIPVVILSNVSDTSIINEAKSRGAVEYIIKSETEPADMITLVNRVLAAK